MQELCYICKFSLHYLNPIRVQLHKLLKLAKLAAGVIQFIFRFTSGLKGKFGFFIPTCRCLRREANLSQLPERNQ